MAEQSSIESIEMGRNGMIGARKLINRTVCALLDCVFSGGWALSSIDDSEVRSALMDNMDAVPELRHTPGEDWEEWFVGLLVAPTRKILAAKVGEVRKYIKQVKGELKR